MEQVEEFETFLEESAKEVADNPSVEVDCDLESQTVVASELTTTYSCTYSSPDTDVTSTSRDFGAFVEENPDTVLGAVQEIEPSVTAASTLSARSTGTFSQVFEVAPGSAPITAEELDAFAGVVESLSESLVPAGSPAVATDCEATSGGQNAVTVTVDYTCVYESPVDGVDPTTLPDAYLELVNTDPTTVTEALAEAEVPVVGSRDVVLIPIGSTGPSAQRSVRSAGSFRQEFELAPGAEPITDVERGAFLGAVESLTDTLVPAGSPAVVTECQIDEEDQTGETLTLEYSCVYESPSNGVDPTTLAGAYSDLVNQEPNTVVDALTAANVPVVGASEIAVAPVRSIGSFTQEFDVAPGAAPLTDVQREAFLGVVESYTPSLVPPGSPAVSTDCQIEEEDQSAETLTIEYTCEYESPSGGVDPSTLPAAYIDLVNTDPSAVATDLSEADLPVAGARDVAVAPTRAIGEYRQSFVVAPGSAPITAAQREAFTDAVESFTTELVPAGSPAVSTECTVDGDELSGEALTIDYSCTYESPSGGVDPASLPDAYVAFVNSDPSDVTEPLSETGLPIASVGPVNINSPFRVPLGEPPADAVRASASFKQDYEISTNRDVLGSDEQLALTGVLESLAPAAVGSESPIWTTCDVDRQASVGTSLSVEYTCEYAVLPNTVDPSEIAPSVVSFVNDNRDEVTRELGDAGLAFEGIQSTREITPIVLSPTPVPFSKESTAQYTQTFVVVPDEEGNVAPLSDDQLASFTNLLENDVLQDEEDSTVETTCTVDGQNAVIRDPEAVPQLNQTLLAVDYTCAFVSEDVDVSSYPRDFLSALNSDMTFEEKVSEIDEDVVGSLPTEFRLAQTEAGYVQTVTVDEGVNSLTADELSEYTRSVSTYVDNLSPDVNSQCTAQQQTASTDQTLDIAFKCDHRAESAGVSLDSFPNDVVTGLSQGSGEIASALRGSGLPIASIDDVRGTDPAYESTVRFTQSIGLPDGSAGWDASNTESFAEVLSAVDFGPYPGESSAECDVAGSSVASFDSSLLAVEYACTLGTSTDIENAGVLFGQTVNANLDTMASEMLEKDVPVAFVGPVASPDVSIPSDLESVCPTVPVGSRVAVGGPTEPITPPVLPATPVVAPSPAPVASTVETEAPVSVAVETAARSFSQEIVVPAGTDLFDETQQAAFTDTVEDVVLASLESPAEIDCSILNQTISADADPESEVLEIGYLCEFSSQDGSADVAADEFATGVSDNLAAVDAGLMSAGLPIVSSRSIDVSEPQRAVPESFSSARFSQVFEIESGSGPWDDEAKADFEATMRSLEFLSGPSSADCSVVDQSVMSFDDSRLAVDYTCSLGSSVGSDESEVASRFGEHVNENLDGIVGEMQERGMGVVSAGPVSSPDLVFSSSSEGASCPAKLIVTATTSTPSSAPAGFIRGNVTVTQSPAASPVAVPVVTTTAMPVVSAARTTRATFTQDVVLTDNASSLSETQTEAFSAAVASFPGNSSPDVSTTCAVTEQTPAADAVSVSYTCTYVGATDEADVDAVALDFFTSVNSDPDALASELTSRGLPVSSIESAVTASPIYRSTGRYSQMFGVPSGYELEGDSVVAFEEVLSEIGGDFMDGAFVADCKVLGASPTSFDDGLLSVDYSMSYGSSSELDESIAAEVGSYLNSVDDGDVVTAFEARGLSVTSVGPLVSSDYDLSTGSVPVCPSAIVA